MSEVYSLVFAFDKRQHRVALIEKKRPAWQKGFLNGIGGSVELGETALLCAQREFKEEAGVHVDVNDLHSFVVLNYPQSHVHCFYCRLDNEDWAAIKTTTDEEIFKISVKEVLDCVRMGAIKMVGNLNWLIPMAIYDAVPKRIDYNGN